MASIDNFHSLHPVQGIPLSGWGGSQTINIRVDQMAQNCLKMSAAHCHTYLTESREMAFQVTPICEKHFSSLWILRGEKGMVVAAFDKNGTDVLGSMETPLFGNDSILLSFFFHRNQEVSYSLSIPPQYSPGTEAKICCGIPEAVHQEQNLLSQFEKLSFGNQSSMEF